MPALCCACILSAHELVYAHRLATVLGTKLGFVLSDEAQTARAFRERFYCSETQLLDFMQVLLPGSSVWNLSQLSRPDIDILRKSNAEAVGLNALTVQGRRSLRRASAEVERLDLRLSENQRRFPHWSNWSVTTGFRDADARIDAATIRAAAALDEPTCGAIAPGMRADLCCFAMPGDDLHGLGSAAFIRLFERQRPDAVLVGGRPEHGTLDLPLDDAPAPTGHGQAD